MKKLIGKFLGIAFIGAAFFTAATTAHAQTQTWNNASTDGLWNGSSLNWSDSLVTPDTWYSGSDAIFGSTGAGTVTVGTGGVTANSLTFNAPGYSLMGAPITLTGAATVTVNSGADVSIDYPWKGTSYFTGTNGLTKAGDGFLGFWDVNYTGATTVNAGTLEVGGSVNLGTVTIANTAGAKLAFNRNNNGTGGTIASLTGGGLSVLDLQGAPNVSIGGDNSSTTFAGTITSSRWGNGNITKEGSGTLTLSGNNDYSGNTTINGGLVDVTGNLYYYGSGSGVITVNSAATLRIYGGWGIGPSGGFGNGGNFDTAASSLVINGGTIDMAASFGDTGRAFAIGANGATLKVESGVTWVLNNDRSWQASGGAVVVTDNSNLTLDGAGTGQVNITVNGTGALTKNGAGSWSIGTAAGYTGSTTVNAGTLILAGGGSISASTQVNIADGATFDTTSQSFTMLGTQTFRFTINGTTNLAGTLNAGTLNISTGVVDFALIGSTLTADHYVLANYTSLVGTQFASVLDLPTGYTLDYAYSGNEIALVQTVPEPTTWAMLLGGLGMLTMFRRRRA